MRKFELVPLVVGMIMGCVFWWFVYQVIQKL